MKAMRTIAKVLLILAVALALLFVAAVAIFVLGAIIFALLGESRYFVYYVGLRGYFPFVNLLFLLDYIAAFLGSFALPVGVVGAVLAVIAKKNT